MANKSNNQAFPDLLNGHPSNKSYNEDEVNLTELFSIVYKRKSIILALFLISITAAIFFNILATRIYEASALIMITPSKIPTALAPTEVSLDVEKKATGEYITSRSTISIPTHKMLLKSNMVLEEIINELQLTDISGNPLTPLSLYGALKVEEPKEEGGEANILKLVVEDTEAKRAEEIANSWAQIYIKYSQELILGEVTGTGDFITEQFEIAKQNLINTERAVKDFNLEKNFAFLSLELDKKDSELKTSYAKIYELDFQRLKKMNDLEKINDDLVVLTKDSQWLGSFDLRQSSLEDFQDESLSVKNQELRSKILQWVKNLQLAEEERDNLINTSRIKLLRKDEENLRDALANDKIALAEINRLTEAVNATLTSGVQLDVLEQIEGGLPQNVSDTTVWEIFSLAEKYNFFVSQKEALVAKVAQEEKELLNLEKTLMEYEKKITELDEEIGRITKNYDFYYNKFSALENVQNSTRAEIDDLEFQLSYEKDTVDRLGLEVKGLRNDYNAQEFELTELERQVDIYQQTYNNLAAKIEDARIIKAAQLGEVRIVSPALESPSPIKPQKRKNMAIFLSLGLMLGIVISFLEEYRKKIAGGDKLQLEVNSKVLNPDPGLKISFLS